jgi:hypothetical protein
MNFKTWFESTVTADQIKDMAAQAKIDLGNVSINQILAGMNIEREHDGKEGSDIDVVKGEIDLLKIAMAHLREDPKYYTKLKKVGL